MRENLIENLDCRSKNKRLNSLKKLKKLELKDESLKPVLEKSEVNCHIHTTYSFSAYTPSKVAYKAYMSGLKACGIIDHDTVAGAKEFLKACQILGIAGSVGFETRAEIKDEELGDCFFNCPEKQNFIYITIHGISHKYISYIDDKLKRLREKRKDNCEIICKKINERLSSINVSVDFNAVIKNSYYNRGGSITSRHILFAVANKLIEKYGKGETLLNILSQDLELGINESHKKLLLDVDNPFYDYDLHEVLKTGLKQFYSDLELGCFDLKELLTFASSIGGIVAYPYIGNLNKLETLDVKDEYEFLDKLVKHLKDLGFTAISYIPSKTTLVQLEMLRTLAKEYDLLEISGEDINSPRQKFQSPYLLDEKFNNLIESAYAVIGNEKMVTIDVADGMFSTKTIEKNKNLDTRIKLYSEIGKV